MAHPDYINSRQRAAYLWVFSMKLLFSLFALALLLMAFFWWALSYHIIHTTSQAQVAAPEGFDGSVYPDLMSLPEVPEESNVSVSHITQIVGDYFLPDLKLAGFVLRAPNYMRRAIFLNNKGEVISDILETQQMSQIGHYLVTPDGYYLISREGLSKRNAMIEISVSATSDLKRMINESRYYRSYSYSDLPTYDPIKGVSNFVHVLHHQGAWKRVVTDDPTHFDWKTDPFPELGVKHLARREKGSPDALNSFGSRFRVEVTHFDRLHHFPAGQPSIGSPTAQGRPEHWTGTGYYTLFADDRPASRFRIENDRESVPSGQTSLSVLGEASLDFVVLQFWDRQGVRHAMIISGN